MTDGCCVLAVQEAAITVQVRGCAGAMALQEHCCRSAAAARQVCCSKVAGAADEAGLAALEVGTQASAGSSASAV